MAEPASATHHPTFCKLEMWNPTKGEWTVAHAGINLLYPHRYVERLAGNGKIGRVTIVDTGEVFQLEEPVLLPLCSYCTDRHDEPHDGTCLI